MGLVAAFVVVVMVTAGIYLFGYAGGNYFSLLNLKAVGEKSNSLLSPAITATVIVLSFFIFDEKLVWRQWIGIMLVLISVIYFLLQPKTTILSNKKNTGFISGLMCVICISLTIICSIKGANSNITFLQAIWIKLLLALIFIVIGLSFIKEKIILNKHPLKFYMIVVVAVICQTIVANYLWFYASFHLGIAVFQLILATLPLCVYAVDVYILKKSANAPLFLLVSVVAALGICLVVL